ncbi:MAG: ABC transporter permease [Candidatus Thorarchaeota archaeon]
MSNEGSLTTLSVAWNRLKDVLGHLKKKLWPFEIRFKQRSSRLTFERAVGIRIISLFLGLLAVAFVFLAYGQNPLELYLEIFGVAFFTRYGIIGTLSRFIPLLLVAIGLAIPFRAKIDNIGAEGQLIVGAIAAAGVAFAFPELPSALLIPLMFLTSFAAGALWALPIAIFRVKSQFKGSDVVISFLLVFPALYLVEYLVTGPWRDREGWGFPQSPLLPDAARIPLIPGTTRIHLTIFVAVVLTLLIYQYLVRTKEGITETKLGYEINVMGENPEAGEATGMSFLKVAIITVLLSGGLAGLAGVSEVAGNPNLYRLRMEISTGLGFTGIAVAWLGGLNPIGVIFSSLFFAALLAGGIEIQAAGMPFGVVNLFNGAILFFVLVAEFFLRFTVEGRLRRDD